MAKPTKLDEIYNSILRASGKAEISTETMSPVFVRAPRTTKPVKRGWRQVGGDVNPATHGAILMEDHGDAVTVLEIAPAVDAGGKDFVRQTGGIFITREAYYDKKSFDWNHRNTKDAANFIGIDSQQGWDALPDERKAEALLAYGAGDLENGTASKFTQALPGGVTLGKVKWWSSVGAVKRDVASAEREFKAILKE